MKSGALELGVGDGGAEVEAFGVSYFAELGDFGGTRQRGSVEAARVLRDN